MQAIARVNRTFAGKSGGLVAELLHAEQVFRGPFLHLHPSGFPRAAASATPGAAAAYMRPPGPSFTKR